MKLIRHILFVFSLFSAGFLLGQDIHFSQFNSSLLNLTPGYNGLYFGDYRVGAVYRSQWQSVPVKYNTFSMHGEKVIKPRDFEKDLIGVGFLFNSDRAGDARYGTTQAYLTGSYIYTGKEDSTLRISIGASLGWCQVGFDFTKMTFDNQYNGLSYDPGLASKEGFLGTNDNFLDINLGAVFQKRFNNKHLLTYGFGFFHLTSPKISYQGNDESKLDYRFTNVISYIVPVRSKIDVIAEALYVTQGKNFELIPHASLKFYFEKKENKAILGGLAYRARDAVIVRLGYTNHTMQSGISYDINMSGFNRATNRRGGFEIFINYIIKLKPSFIARKRPCPIYM